MVHHQHLRLVVQLGVEHGYRTVVHDVNRKSCSIPRNVENLHVLCQDARTETENRRDKQEVPQAGRCHEEAAGSDGPLQPVRSQSDGRMSADADTVPYLDGLVHVRAECIELRQQSFLWADDLSTYDAFINFPFHIPFLGSHLSLFCLLMTVTNILNTKYMMQQQDTGANPQMAAMKWMSYLMPIMFLFILNDYPSGLNYYYFISTLVSVVTTLIMRKTTNEEALLAQLEANKKDPKKMKKTGFAARLEAMQKQQEQMMKEKQNKK